MIVSIDQYVYTNTGGDRRECKAKEHKPRDAYRLSAVPDVTSLDSIQIWVDFHLKGLGLRDRFLFPDEEAVEQEEEVVQVACHVEDAAPLHEPHVLGVLLIADHEADACNLF